MVGRANAQTNVTTRPCDVASYTPLCPGPNGPGRRQAFVRPTGPRLEGHGGLGRGYGLFLKPLERNPLALAVGEGLRQERRLLLVQLQDLSQRYRERMRRRVAAIGPVRDPRRLEIVAMLGKQPGERSPTHYPSPGHELEDRGSEHGERLVCHGFS